jgi:hypothetical protein
MGRLNIFVLLYLGAVYLGLSGLTHLMPLMGGDMLNPLSNYLGSDTWAWELLAAGVLAVSAFIVQIGERGGQLPESPRH